MPVVTRMAINGVLSTASWCCALMLKKLLLDSDTLHQWVVHYTSDVQEAGTCSGTLPLQSELHAAVRLPC